MVKEKRILPEKYEKEDVKLTLIELIDLVLNEKVITDQNTLDGFARLRAKINIELS